MSQTAALNQCALTLEEMANVLRAVNRAGCADICDAQAMRAREAAQMNPRVKYPLESLRVGESLMIEAPRPHLRGSLYNRAETLGIAIRCNMTNLGLKVTRTL